MNSRYKIYFLALVLFQGLHSIEEYIGEIWVIFTPAKFLTGLISENNEQGFIIANIMFFFFGIWCWLCPINQNKTYARTLVWIWVVIEMINGTGHSIVALNNRAYFPGVITALFLLPISLYLLRFLLVPNFYKKNN